MIDCGVAYKRVEPYLSCVKTLLITHNHSDHVKPSTLSRIKKEWPGITTFGNWEVAQSFNNVDYICNAGFPVFTQDNICIEPFECKHNTTCTGYTWEDPELGRTIYATDTQTFDNAPDGLYDTFLIESNHDETKLRLAKHSGKYGYNAYAGGMRHASTQQAKAFYYTRRTSKKALFIEMHKSKRFY